MVPEPYTLYAVYGVQAAGTALLACLLAVFYRLYGHDYLREWSWSWAALCVYVVGALIGVGWTRALDPLHPARLAASVATLAGGYWQVAFLLFGTRAVARGTPLPARRRRLVLLLLLGAAVLLILASAEGAAAGQRFFLRVGVRTGVAAAAYLWAAAWLAREGGMRREIGRAIVAVSFLAYGLEQGNYFVLIALDALAVRPLSEIVALLGFVDFLIQFTMGMGMVIWLLEEERNALQRTSDALRNSEERLLQSQRLEAVGQLAGGVAHDFNNLLTVIVGRGEILLDHLPRGSSTWREVSQIKEAAERGASLVRQLLAFSRRQVLAPRQMSVNEAVLRVRSMLQRSIGEEIGFRCALADRLGDVQVDPAQFEQVLVNLALNARDAMPEGGLLTISTANVQLSEAEARAISSAMQAGEHVLLSVRDTGVGMDEEVRRRALEPFFTTKEVGKGSGLGLASVYGIVKQSGGFLTVSSAPEKGTEVCVYLPGVAAAAEEEGRSAERQSWSAVAAQPGDRGERNDAGRNDAGRNDAGHGDAVRNDVGRNDAGRGDAGRILVVEDEYRIRGLLTSVLEDQGYEVLVANDGAQALALADDGADVDLLLTDVVMPHIGGAELADRLEARLPALKVLFMSGYSEEIVSARMVTENRAVLEKPFTLPELLRSVRAALDGEPSAAGAATRPMGVSPQPPVER